MVPSWYRDNLARQILDIASTIMYDTYKKKPYTPYDSVSSSALQAGSRHTAYVGALKFTQLHVSQASSQVDTTEYGIELSTTSFTGTGHKLTAFFRMPHGLVLNDGAENTDEYRRLLHLCRRLVRRGGWGESHRILVNKHVDICMEFLTSRGYDEYIPSFSSFNPPVVWSDVDDNVNMLEKYSRPYVVVGPCYVCDPDRRMALCVREDVMTRLRDHQTHLDEFNILVATTFEHIGMVR